jgi:4-hydroxybenzoate polyprenyltransferase
MILDKRWQQFAKLFRMKQWVKNVFVFFPLLFSGHFGDEALLFNCFLLFCGFCLVASGVYIFNDFLDVEQDRKHPTKKHRPLAQESVSKPAVLILILTVLTVGLWVCYIAGSDVLYLALMYLALNVVYNFYAKKVVLLDVIFVAIGFLVRVWLGALATGIIPSVWLQMCVFLLALFLGFSKRRYELATLRETAHEHRGVLRHYTAYLLDQIIIICSTLAIVFYGLYTISDDVFKRMGNYDLVYSVPFVIYGIFRYLYLIHVKKLGDEPAELLFSDRPLLINVLLWIGVLITIIYSHA